MSTTFGWMFIKALRFAILGIFLIFFGNEIIELIKIKLTFVLSIIIRTKFISLALPRSLSLRVSLFATINRGAQHVILGIIRQKLGSTLSFNRRRRRSSSLTEQ